jgi:hypothetical protein
MKAASNLNLLGYSAVQCVENQQMFRTNISVPFSDSKSQSSKSFSCHMLHGDRHCGLVASSWLLNGDVLCFL